MYSVEREGGRRGCAPFTRMPRGFAAGAAGASVLDILAVLVGLVRVVIEVECPMSSKPNETLV